MKTRNFSLGLLDKEMGEKMNFVIMYLDGSKNPTCSKMERGIDSHKKGMDWKDCGTGRDGKVNYIY